MSSVTQISGEPFAVQNEGSTSSTRLSASDFGESGNFSADFHPYPRLIPVFNGEILSIKSDLLHEGLSGISIKHHYGKCYNEAELIENNTEEEFDYKIYENEGECEEMYECDFFESSNKLCLSSKPSWKVSRKNLTVFESRTITNDEANSFDHLYPLKPDCLKPRINRRNSFWNIHRPELCKLTWPQKYVSRATVMAFLHDHLMSHGSYCTDIHTEEDRENMLRKELNDFGRLKILVSPREIPPEEKPISLKITSTLPAKCRTYLEKPKCGGFPRKSPEEEEIRVMQLSDDEEVPGGKILRRSKEEFCLTIGRHIQKPTIRKSVSEIEETHEEQEASYNMGEEESNYFFDNWLKNTAEECYDEDNTDASTIEFEAIAARPLVEPCPVIGANDFCRAVAKADFSDLRCHPDDF